MRSGAGLLALLLGACAPVVSTPPAGSNLSGQAYNVPAGRVQVEVRTAPTGVFLLVHPPRMVADGAVGPLVADLSIAPLNKEDIKVNVNDETGLLESVTVGTTARIVAIGTEAGRAVGTLTAQNAALVKETVHTDEHDLDPLSCLSLQAVNDWLGEALVRAETTHRRLTQTSYPGATVRLDVISADGTRLAPATGQCAPATAVVAGCPTGVCYRKMTSRLLEVSVNGRPVAARTIEIPGRPLFSLPIPSTVLADQTIVAAFNNGLLSKYTIDREAEAMSVVKLPGAVVGGLVNGVVEQFTNRKRIAEAELAAKEAELAVKEAELAAKEAKDTGNGSGMEAQNTEIPAPEPFAKTGEARALVVYPHPETLHLIAKRGMNAQSGGRSGPAPPTDDPSLTDPAPDR